MNPHQVMTELAEALDTIDGLRVFPFWAERVEPPAAVVQWPDPLDYDTTMGRGSDSATFPVMVLVGNVDARSASAQLGAYCDGAGPSSVKGAIEGHAPPVTYDSATVSRAEQFSVVTVAGVECLAATFQVDVVATGD